MAESRKRKAEPEAGGSFEMFPDEICQNLSTRDLREIVKVSKRLNAICVPVLERKVCKKWNIIGSSPIVFRDIEKDFHRLAGFLSKCGLGDLQIVQWNK